MSEYKAGDVVEHAKYGRGFVYNGGAHTYVVFGDGGGRQVMLVADDLRPLAAIDPESAEDVERLIGLHSEAIGRAIAKDGFSETFDSLQAALREYAKPTPEPLTEPTDLSARVIDEDGDEWARSVHGGLWRCLTLAANPTGWDDLARLHGPLRLAGGE